jgi:hypothetical protein
MCLVEALLAALREGIAVVSETGIARTGGSRIAMCPEVQESGAVVGESAEGKGIEEIDDMGSQTEIGQLPLRSSNCISRLGQLILLSFAAIMMIKPLACPNQVSGVQITWEIFVCPLKQPTDEAY